MLSNDRDLPTIGKLISYGIDFLSFLMLFRAKVANEAEVSVHCFFATDFTLQKIPCSLAEILAQFRVEFLCIWRFRAELTTAKNRSLRLLRFLGGDFGMKSSSINEEEIEMLSSASSDSLSDVGIQMLSSESAWLFISMKISGIVSLVENFGWKSSLYSSIFRGRVKWDCFVWLRRRKWSKDRSSSSLSLPQILLLFELYILIRPNWISNWVHRPLCTGLYVPAAWKW